MCFCSFVWKKLKTPKRHFEIIWPLENILWNLTAIRYDFKKALSQMYFCYRSPMGGLKLACWPRYWLCACSISLMEQTLLWRLWPSHMMSLVKTDGQMEAVSTSLNAFLLLKKRHFGFRVSRCLQFFQKINKKNPNVPWYLRLNWFNSFLEELKVPKSPVEINWPLSTETRPHHIWAQTARDLLVAITT